MDDALRTELLAMVGEDQAALKAAQAFVEATPELMRELDRQYRESGRHIFTLLHARFDDEVPGPFAEAFRINDHNIARLRSVVEEHQWPGRTLVGEDGADAAWLVS